MGWLKSIRARSISVLVIQAGGCRGCALQFSMALSQNISVKGITITGNPKHADVLLITGCINEKSRENMRSIYKQMPSPKAVIAAGACSCSGSLFCSENNRVYPAEDVIPVDSWVRGCTPGFDEMLEAVRRAIECVCEEKGRGGGT